MSVPATVLEPIVVELTQAIKPKICAVCLRAIEAFEIYVFVGDGATCTRLHGACSAAATDPEMRRCGLEAVAWARARSQREHPR